MRTAQQDRKKTAEGGPQQDAGQATEPQASWDVKRLMAYARREIREAVALGKRTAVHLYRAGHALSLIRKKLKPSRQWVKWQEEHQLPRTVVNDAIRLYAAAGNEKAVTGLTVMEAYDSFGIAKRARSDNGEGHERAVWNGVPLRSAAIRKLPPLRKARIIHAALAYLLDDLTRQGRKRPLKLKPTLDLIVELVEAVRGVVQEQAGREGGE